MADCFAELTLYFGWCSSGGLSEGDFDLDRHSSNFALDRKLSGLHRVEQYLGHSLRECLGYGREGLRMNEDAAETLIEFCKENIGGTEPTIELEYVMHGRLRFFRKIIFNGWSQDRKEDLVQMLKNSGYKPYNPEEKELETIRGISEEYYQERLASFDHDRPWKESLKFCR